MSRKKSSSVSRDEPDNVVKQVEEDRQFFADNDLPTIKQQQVCAPQIKSSKQPALSPSDITISASLDGATEDFTLTTNRKLSTSSLKAVPKQVGIF